MANSASTFTTRAAFAGVSVSAGLVLLGQVLVLGIISPGAAAV